MARSGTYNFNLDIDEVIQEATEMIGGEQTLGHTPQSARRYINLLLITPIALGNSGHKSLTSKIYFFLLINLATNAGTPIVRGVEVA